MGQYGISSEDLQMRAILNGACNKIERGVDCEYETKQKGRRNTHPKIRKLQNGNRIRVLLDRYSNGEIETIFELVAKAENIKNPQVQKVVDTYRRFQQEDRFEYGMRGDWDEAERAFINALEKLASEFVRAKEEKEVVNQIALSPGWKGFLDKAISERRPIDAILVSAKVEDGKAAQEYLQKAGYVLKDDKYVP